MDQENKKVVFELDKPVVVELDSEQPIAKEDNYGNTVNYYPIKRMMSGENIIKASAGLHKQIQEGNFSKGYRMEIVKINFTTKAGDVRQCFNVKPLGQASEKAEDTPAKEEPLASSGLSMEERVAKLERQVHILQKL